MLMLRKATRRARNLESFGFGQARSLRRCSNSPDFTGNDVIVRDAEGTDGLVSMVMLNRPHRLNAFSFEMGEKLTRLHDLVPSTARAIVVTGYGDKAFSTGRDLKDSHTHTTEQRLRYMRLCREAALAMKRCHVPVVAAINGFCFGWGLEMALGCDLRVAYADACLCFPETSLGIFPGAMGSVFLPRLVGSSIAKDLILTSRRFSGKEALSLGVVNRTAESSESCVSDAVKLAHQIALNGPLGVKAGRTVIEEGLDMSLDEHIALSDRHRYPLNDSEDFKEALVAFQEKRKVVFKGK